ncbi:MAG: ATP-binding protein [Kiritimatiellae bacterium]|nr:ATP-binding protein [Kiritimatiellia bacterium]MDD5521359.1 ATP-binding protein [Kiritimatiellia bacterium]
MESYLREIVQLSLGSSPEEMLRKSLDACIELSGAKGGSILGEEGPYLQFLFSDVSDLVGVKVPFSSIAGVTVNKSMVIYTYAPSDKRHFSGVDTQIHQTTKYLLSIPIPSIHRNTGGDMQARNAGALQLLFTDNIFPALSVADGPREFHVDAFKESVFFQGKLKSIFLLLPVVAFALEVMKLRQTSYQAIHELKNKLISGLSWIGYLKNDIRQCSPELLNNEGIAGDFELAETSIKEGAELAKTYLQFTKIYNPKFSQVNVNDILNDTASSVRALVCEMKIPSLEVIVDCDANIPTKKLDGVQLKMALFNLCKNAVEVLAKYDIAQPRLGLVSAFIDGKIQVQISDNGPGMPKEIADNLFVPFKTKKEGGTGLGLTITKKIIDIHGGTIKSETSSSGTKFTIEL